jgi:hypothetical protein
MEKFSTEYLPRLRSVSLCKAIMNSIPTEYLTVMGPLKDESERLTFKRFIWLEPPYDLLITRTLAIKFRFQDLILKGM